MWERRAVSASDAPPTRRQSERREHMGGGTTGAPGEAGLCLRERPPGQASSIAGLPSASDLRITMSPRPSIALVHDYLTQRGGAERVVLLLTRAFPDATLYTSLYAPENRS